jgi:hypothetical protein
LNGQKINGAGNSLSFAVKHFPPTLAIPHDIHAKSTLRLTSKDLEFGIFHRKFGRALGELPLMDCRFSSFP